MAFPVHLSAVIADPAVDLEVRHVRQSTVPEQGTAVVLKVCSIDVSCYSGYGPTPAELAARLRELADQIEVQAAAAATIATANEAVA